MTALDFLGQDVGRARLNWLSQGDLSPHLLFFSSPVLLQPTSAFALKELHLLPCSFHDQCHESTTSDCASGHRYEEKRELKEKEREWSSCLPLPLTSSKVVTIAIVARHRLAHKNRARYASPFFFAARLVLQSVDRFQLRKKEKKLIHTTVVSEPEKLQPSGDSSAAAILEALGQFDFLETSQGKDDLTLSDVKITLKSKDLDLQKENKSNGGNLYVRGRVDRVESFSHHSKCKGRSKS
ncbi:hypothetical protein M9H77_04266 [Catharanthus roseus]|uniref:Uncharacterized protein n=1 Tax=Catharanthus roseus TaxID=4058 RepID=A0ACC0CE56_CATRO|nr:hypothetical protein M9H77_04266 [Catharanthus roseus]